MAFMFALQQVPPGADAGAALALIVIAGLFYFLPTAIAMARGKANTGAILIVNLFFGWTVIGWVVALVWAASTQMVDARTGGSAGRGKATCPSCGVKQDAAPKCMNCGTALVSPSVPGQPVCVDCGTIALAGSPICPTCRHVYGAPAGVKATTPQAI